MAKYLRTSGISSELEELITVARERLYIISPYLKLSDKIKELLSDKEREKVEVRLIFGKQELNPNEMSFLENLKYVRLYFSKNLHAKCYLNEFKMIITSMNLHEFSQQNNREMGILIDRSLESDKIIYEDAWRDIESLINNSEDFAYAKINKDDSKAPTFKKKIVEVTSDSKKYAGQKFSSTSALSKELGVSAKELFSLFEKKGLIVKKNNDWILTIKGNELGAQIKSGQYGEYIAWPQEILPDIVLELK